ncbi:unnamed protein product [Pieris macdunnoughi]|uniref:Uncharacterized protein n=2 Tax=Pieris TaxID=7115 RepID=A0A9P0TEW9_PIEBR|nr:unnamed protein product [Pieris macdunnoughi]CAH4030946.1 unnamed protein product [Pieris brassicae]
MPIAFARRRHSLKPPPMPAGVRFIRYPRRLGASRRGGLEPRPPVDGSLVARLTWLMALCRYLRETQHAHPALADKQR